MLRPLIPSIALCPLLFACAEPPAEGPVSKGVEDPVRTVRAPAPPIDVAKPPPKIARDPYESYLRTPDADGDGALGKSALERIPLDRLRLVGVVQQTAPLALFEDDTGLGHVVHIGTAIGTDGGRVKHIKGDHVVVEERFYDPVHRVIPVEKTIVLASASG